MLYLIRHGETEWNRTGRIQGRSNIPLSDAGEKEARVLSGLMEKIRFAQIVSSDLERAHQTAIILSRGECVVTKDARLRERSYGRYEGMTVDEIVLSFQREHPAFNREEFDPVLRWPEGCGVERFEDVLERGRAAVLEYSVRAKEADIALVTHGNVLSALLYWTLGIPQNEPRCFRLANCMCAEIGIEGGRPALRSLVSPSAFGGMFLS